MPSPAQGNKRTTGDVERPSKRSRVSRACDQCRTAREKCDGTQPICITCSAGSRPCTYTTNPKKRGIQPGYIRTLELALTWIFNNVPDAESALNKKLVDDGIRSVLLSRDSKDSNRLHKSWRKSRFCRDVDKLLSGEQIADPTSPESEQDTDSEVINVQSPSPELGRAESIAIALDPLDNMPTPTVRINEASQLISLPLNRWRLFDIYFSYTHSWFPICEKHDILRLTYSYPDTGLRLTSTMAHSGEHAELWSILALASLHESEQPFHQQLTHSRLYNVALSLIPFETGSFEFGHVKALLVLALAHMARGFPENAWLLIGFASRIMIVLEEKEKSTEAPNHRLRHVAAGCFLLDTTLSLQLQRRPYLQAADVERLGKISEDGIEEWQPWAGSNDSQVASTFRQPVPRSPALSLSTFNNLIDLVGILNITFCGDASRNNLREALGRFEIWKTSLPSKLDYVRLERASTPMTPPAVLFQLLYYYTASALYASPTWIQQITELLEQAREAMSLAALPPLVVILLHLTGETSSYRLADYRIQGRYQTLRSECSELQGPGPSMEPLSSMPERMYASSRQSFGSTTMQVPTPESLRIPHSISFTPIHHNQTVALGRPATASTLLDDLLPDMNVLVPSQRSMAFSGIQISPYEGAFESPVLHHQNSSTSRDIDNFFDELASLDGAERGENQPQFMQNLGFAPDANIADLLAPEFGQMNSLSSFMAPGNSDPTSLDPVSFYDGRHS